MGGLRRYGGLALVLLLLGLALAWISLRRMGGGNAWPAGQMRITVSKETTWLTEPLSPDGYVDYLAAINQLGSAGITPENNAAVPIAQAFGPAEIPVEQREEFYRLLGIAPLPEKGDYFVTLDSCERARHAGGVPPGMPGNGKDEPRRLSEQVGDALKRPWSRQEFPALAEWMERNEHHVRAIAAASRRPRCFGPLVCPERPPMVMAALQHSSSQFREAGEALVARAMLRLHGGAVGDAGEDLIACHRLGRLAAQGPTIIDLLRGIALDGIACQGDVAMALHGRLTSRQAMDRIAELRTLPPWPSLVDKVNSAERFQTLDGVQFMARGAPEKRSGSADDAGPTGGMDEIARSVGLAVFDWDRVLRLANSWMDRYVDALSKPTRTDRMAALKAIDEELHQATRRQSFGEFVGEFFSGRSPRALVADKIGTILTALTFPMFEALSRSEDRAKAQFQMTLVALALAAHRADRGSYPEKLSDLCPKYLGEIPGDPCGDGPLQYRRSGNQYVLSSVGWNGKDDGGHSHSDPDDKEATSEQDDIVIRSAAPSQGRF